MRKRLWELVKVFFGKVSAQFATFNPHTRLELYDQIAVYGKIGVFKRETKAVTSFTKR